MVKNVRLDLEQRKTEWLFTAWLDDFQLAELKAIPSGNNVLLHLNVYAWSKWLYREYINCFLAVRDFLREQGCVLIIASAGSNDKVEHFWRLMGFGCVGQFSRMGNTYAFAVMEA